MSVTPQGPFGAARLLTRFERTVLTWGSLAFFLSQTFCAYVCLSVCCVCLQGLPCPMDAAGVLGVVAGQHVPLPTQAKGRTGRTNRQGLMLLAGAAFLNPSCASQCCRRVFVVVVLF